jgi:hypothetical protein
MMKESGGKACENKKVKTLQLYKKIKVVSRLGLCVCVFVSATAADYCH